VLLLLLLTPVNHSLTAKQKNDYLIPSMVLQGEMYATKKVLFFKSKLKIFNLLDLNGCDLIDFYEKLKDEKVFIIHIFRRKK
jgi:hypothetical protein